MKRVLCVLLCAITFSASAQKLGDTIKKDLLTAPDTVKKLHSKALAFIAPAVLIAYGASSFVIHPIRQVDYYVHGETQATGPDFHSKAESYFQFAPVAIVYGLNLV